MYIDDNFELLEESLLYDRLKYSKIYRTDVLLPRGDPNGYNMLITVIGKDITSSLPRLMSGKAITVPPSYRYLLKPAVSSKRIFGTTKRISVNRKEIRTFARNNRLTWINNTSSNASVISDVTTEMSLYFAGASTRQLAVGVKGFPKFLSSNIASLKLKKPELQRNIIVIDALDYTFTKTSMPNDLKSNPIFMIYKIMKDFPDLVQELNYDFILMGLNASVMFNPVKINAQEAKQFFTNLFIFMKINMRELDLLQKELEREEAKNKKSTDQAAAVDLSKLTGPAKSIVADQLDDSKPTSTSVTRNIQAVRNVPKAAISSSNNISDSQPKDQSKPTTVDNSKRSLSTVVDVEDENKPKTNTVDDNMFDDMLSSDDEAKQKSGDPDDEIFNPDGDEDPFGKEETKIRRPVTRIKSKVIIPGSPKQQELLRQQDDIKVRGSMTVKDHIKVIPYNVEVPTTDHSSALMTHNEEVQSSRYENFRKTYMEEGFDSDMVKSFTALNAKDNAFYIKDIQIYDNSDTLNYLDTWEVTYIDQYGIQTTVKLDIPKMYDNKYFLLGGNMKTLENQNAPLPIIKTGPNRVIIATNYNKIFMERYDTRSITTVTRLAKMISFDENHEYFTTGNSRIDNQGYSIPLTMSEVAKHVLEFHGNDTHMYFNMKLPIMQKHNNNRDDGLIWIGTNNGAAIIIDASTGKDEAGKGIIDYIIENVPEEYRLAYNSVKIGKVNMYSRMKMNMKNVPCLFIISYWIGLREVLEKSGVHWYFVPDDSNKTGAAAISIDKKDIRIRFRDGSLYYKDSEFSELLLNPLLNLNTKDIIFSDTNEPETWEEILANIYGSYRSLNVIKSFKEWMIDHITLELLQAYNLPETISELIILGTRMLSDNNYVNEINDELQRTRHAEVIPSMVYYRLANQYTTYTSTGGRSKMTLPRDAIVKDILALTTLEDTSIINPAYEISKDAAVSKRGHRGTNLDAAYTLALRTYSEDSVGKLAITGGMSGNVGVQRYLTHEPDFKNIRGIRERGKTIDEMSGAEVLSSVEMLIPMSAMHDDATRVGNGVKQQGHSVWTNESDPALLTNGVDEAIRFRLSSEYVVNAAADGKVIEYDEQSGMMVVQYKPYDAKPGKFRAFKLKEDIVKNSGGGIYFSKKLTSPLKVGDTFKKDEVLAYHDKYFTYSKINGLCYNIGPLIRVALHATSEAYEDGGWMTEGAAEKMGTAIIYQENAQLDRNANIANILKVGDHVDVDDKLIAFSSGTNDAQLNKLLAALDDDTISSLQMGKKSEHAGSISEIIIYSQVDPEECSPSVKKLLLAYRDRVQRVGKVLDKYDKGTSIVKAGYLNKSPDTNIQSQYGKIKGIETDILIEFYIKHDYNLSTGDKFILYSSNKNTASKIVPEEFAGWSEDNPKDPIQSGISPSPLSKRMLGSPEIVLAYTTCLIELQREILNIWNSK